MEDVRKDIAFTFGRFNPPTAGHEKLLNAVKDHSKGGPYRIYVSPSHDNKKNPLPPREKIGHMREMFPKHARAIASDHDAANILQVCSKLYDQGYSEITVVVGSDRVDEFSTLLKKYNGSKNLSTNGFYNFKSIKVVSAGDRDPDSDDVEGVSASKMRGAAQAGDHVAFAKGLPHGYKNSKHLFTAVRRGLGLEESTDAPHVQLDPVSETREAYVQGGLFQIDEEVIVVKSGQHASIKHLGSNYLVIQLAESGDRKRVWLTDVHKVLKEEARPIHSSGKPLSTLR